MVREPGQFVLCLAQIGVPRELGGHSGREEGAADVEGARLDRLFVDVLLLVLLPRVLRAQVGGHRLQRLPVEGHPPLQHGGGGGCGERVGDRLPGKVDIAGAGLLAVVELPVLDGLGGQLGDSFEEEGGAAAVAD
jgi:hypothetical protein